FGPWVGLFTGFVGNLLGDLISGFGGPWWSWDLGNGLIGFIPGLAIYLTGARYRSTRNIVIAEIFGIIGIVFGLAVAAYGDMTSIERE
ncbi:MAG TPA: ECF transporter S component, partial [Ktedonosporobacter sp.]|nr:ECF transporter S component [Ktedonosporobacter sp.]